MNETTPLIDEEKINEDGFRSSKAVINSIRRSTLNKDGLEKILWSTTLRDNLNKHEADLVEATFLLRDAVFLSTKSIFADFEGHNPFVLDSGWKSKASFFCHNVMAWKDHLIRKTVFWISAVGMIVLSFLEPPPWCSKNDFDQTVSKLNKNEFTNGKMCQYLLESKGPPAFGNTSEIVQYYPNWGITVLSNQQSINFMWFFLSLIIIDLLLSFGKSGFSMKGFLYLRASRGFNAIERMSSSNSALASRHLAIGRMIRIILIISTTILCFETFKSYDNNWSRPYSPLCRGLIFACYSHGLQRELVKSIDLIPSLLGSLFALFLAIFIYGWIGVVAFYETQEGKESFSSLVEAMWTLWTCVTTANYPDVMMTAYNENKIVVVYFVSFMLLTFFFLMNVILGSIVQKYNEESETMKATMSSLIQTHMESSFELLDEDNKGTISRETIFDVFVKLNELCSDIRLIPDDRMEFLFATLDKDGSNSISMDEYMDFGHVLKLEIHEYAGYTTFIEENMPCIYNSAMFQKFSSTIKSKCFEHLIDLVLCLNAIVVTVQSYPLLSGKKVEIDPLTLDGSIDTPLEIFETIFTLIYCLEIAAKLIVLGGKRFFESGRNVFDATITLLVVLSALVVYYPNQFNDPQIIRVVLMVRVLRLLRLLTGMKNFQIIGETLIEAIPHAKRIITYLLFIMYLVTSVGVAKFGGLITRNPASRYAHLLKDTSFADANYWGNNFNDYPSGFNTLFNLLIINNWPEMADGIVAVTESRVSRLFFLFFHILGVIVIGNLVVALVIDTFMEKYEEVKNEGKKANGSEKTNFNASTKRKNLV